jgi:TRAP-type uncharacterized transport system substrate-binding protein
MMMTIRYAVLALALIGAAGGASGQSVEISRQRSSVVAVGSVSVRADPSVMQALGGLTAALDAQAVHVAPIAGQGPVQSIANLLGHRGADAAIVPSDVLPYLRRDSRFPKVDLSIGYVTKLDQEEVHILARREIASVADLAGKRVSFGAPDSRAFITGSVLFQALQVNAQPVSLEEPRALEQLRRGEIAAIVHVAKSPARLFFDVNRDDGVHFVPVPFTAELARTYVPARLSPADYPLLIGGGEAGRGVAVATVAVPIVLAVNDRMPAAARYSEVFRLVDALSLSPSGPSPGTATVTAYQAAEVPGWRRIIAADLRQKNVARAASRHETQGARQKDAEASATPRSSEASQNKEELAQQFIHYWQQHAFAEKHQSDASQESSGTSTQRRSGVSAAAAAQEWETLMREFLRWRAQNHPEQSPQASGEVFEEVLHTLYKP